jgi:uncharacterized protein
MDRFDRLKTMVVNFLMENNPGYAPIGISHLAYSACLCALLARKRGLDMEIAQTAGYLHDVWLHLNAPYDDGICARHAREGARLAEKIMREHGGYADEEIETVCRMIENHDFTAQEDDPMSEIMKDADMFSHYLNASAAGREGDFHARASDVLREFGVSVEKQDEFMV